MSLLSIIHFNIAIILTFNSHLPRALIRGGRGRKSAGDCRFDVGDLISAQEEFVLAGVGW
jgi:hypothetical protein